VTDDDLRPYSYADLVEVTGLSAATLKRRYAEGYIEQVPGSAACSRAAALSGG
jgi:hypothetical protein